MNFALSGFFFLLPSRRLSPLATVDVPYPHPIFTFNTSPALVPPYAHRFARAFFFNQHVLRRTSSFALGSWIFEARECLLAEQLEYCFDRPYECFRGRIGRHEEEAEQEGRGESLNALSCWLEGYSRGPRGVGVLVCGRKRDCTRDW